MQFENRLRTRAERGWVWGGRHCLWLEFPMKQVIDSGFFQLDSNKRKTAGCYSASEICCCPNLAFASPPSGPASGIIEMDGNTAHAFLREVTVQTQEGPPRIPKVWPHLASVSFPPLFSLLWENSKPSWTGPNLTSFIFAPPFCSWIRTTHFSLWPSNFTPATLHQLGKSSIATLSIYVPNPVSISRPNNSIPSVTLFKETMTPSSLLFWLSSIYLLRILVLSAKCYGCLFILYLLC